MFVFNGYPEKCTKMSFVCTKSRVSTWCTDGWHRAISSSCRWHYTTATAEWPSFDRLTVRLSADKNILQILLGQITCQHFAYWAIAEQLMAWRLAWAISLSVSAIILRLFARGRFKPHAQSKQKLCQSMDRWDFKRTEFSKMKMMYGGKSPKLTHLQH